MYAITRSLDEVLDSATAAELDLNDIARGDGTLFVRDGVGFAGRGRRRVSLPTVRPIGCRASNTIRPWSRTDLSPSASSRSGPVPRATCSFPS